MGEKIIKIKQPQAVQGLLGVTAEGGDTCWVRHEYQHICDLPVEITLFDGLNCKIEWLWFYLLLFCNEFTKIWYYLIYVRQ